MYNLEYLSNIFILSNAICNILLFKLHDIYGISCFYFPLSAYTQCMNNFKWDTLWEEHFMFYNLSYDIQIPSEGARLR